MMMIIIIAVVVERLVLTMKDSRMDGWQKGNLNASHKKAFIFVLFYQQNLNEKRNNVQSNFIIKLHCQPNCLNFSP